MCLTARGPRTNSLLVVLSALLVGAHGPARDEQSGALGLSQDVAPAVATALASLVDAEDALHLATGLWADPSISVLASFIDACGFAMIGEIPDKAVLDAWGSAHTNGLIDTFPLTPSPYTLLLLASAVVAELEWVQPFDPRSGSWGDMSDNVVVMLHAATTDLDRAAIIDDGDGAVGRFCCASTSSIDVHLVSGRVEGAPGEVLALAIDALGNPSLVRKGSELSLGEHAGALSVREISGIIDGLRIARPAFSLGQSHDLLDAPEVWGLDAARDVSRGHFAGIADEPLAVEAGVHDALVEFNALGFRAAAVTAMSVMPGAALPSERCRLIEATFDEPFGFLAVHRDTGLVFFSGWVATHDALRLDEASS